MVPGKHSLVHVVTAGSRPHFSGVGFHSHLPRSSSHHPPSHRVPTVPWPVRQATMGQMFGSGPEGAKPRRSVTGQLTGPTCGWPETVLQVADTHESLVAELSLPRPLCSPS